ncbi:hypothetical protein [Micromonospora gifhornensis]|uniref:Uncharacterized protein n=1 Tax=Micromonospora gifhornensis TaxID=84594 RepID=A0ABQ4IBR6_9ACTN|nr:hypothetical protein [Micromonospora gifhornensis]GIJ15358.1 hypothetical protein Vgi01_20420 [Micromonospora gifhornensis]
MSDSPDEQALWLQRAFDEHRRELHVHCYRLAGNVTDADDLLRIENGKIVESNAFIGARHVAAFGMPATLEPDAGAE